jgi:hypothetical protein
MFLGNLIYYRWCLLRFGSLCRAAYPHRQACLGYFDHDAYPPTIDWAIKLVIITASPDQDSADDYLEIGESTCEDLTEEGHLIVMVTPAGGPLQHSSTRYPTIGRSEASDTRTPDNGMIQNLNLDFNAIRL